MKKFVTLLLVLSMVLGLTGCGFSVGTPSSDEDYKDIFTDRAASEGSTYKHSFVAYDFTLGEYGGMKVYVDTSEGHKFELQSENGGFNILDKDGNVVLYAAAVNDGAYAEMTAVLDRVETYNGRDFFASYNGDGSVDMFSYMADCGLNCGFVLESKDSADKFSLVAFRGTPIEGSSSDIYAYKGSSDEMVDEEVADELIEDVEDAYQEDADVSDSLNIVSTLDPEVEKALASLETDYSKILWGVTYSMFEDDPGFVVSVTPYCEYGVYKLLIGLTNLTGRDVSFSGSATAMDADNNEEGSTFIFAMTIGSGNTYVDSISCGQNMPTGVIHWEDCVLKDSETVKYIPWELDYAGSGNPADGYITADYEIYSANNEAIDSSEVYAFVLDENGFVLASGMDFISDGVAAGAKYAGSINIYNDAEYLAGASDLAFFANPYVINN